MLELLGDPVRVAVRQLCLPCGHSLSGVAMEDSHGYRVEAQMLEARFGQRGTNAAGQSSAMAARTMCLNELVEFRLSLLRDGCVQLQRSDSK